MILEFYYALVKLLDAFRRGIRDDHEFRVLLFLLLYLITGATVFYWRTEGWTFIDALYFSVMTISTIGYGDFTPTTPLSKLFTIVYAIVGIGVFIAVISKIVAIVLERGRSIREGARHTASSIRDKIRNRKIAGKTKKKATEKTTGSKD